MSEANEDKAHGRSTLTIPSSGDSSSDETRRNEPSHDHDTEFTFARRGEQLSESIDSSDVYGYDAARMRDRALLTAEEEKALMRRVDWRIMVMCSLLFLMKNLDSDNISNAKIMNRGTDRNVLTQLNMSSDEYNLLTVFYYVCSILSMTNGRLLTSNRFRISCSKRRRTCCSNASSQVPGSPGL